jgi:prevent-host-death family protein
MAKSVTASNARAGFAETLNRVAYGGERVVLKKHGKAVAAVVPIDDYLYLEKLEDEWAAKAVKKARKEKGEAVPLEEVKRRFGLK